MGRIRKIGYRISRGFNTSGINKFQYKAKKMFMNLIPSKMKKPIRLVSAIFGLWFYLLLMIKLTNSDFLIQAKSFIITIFSFVSEQTNPFVVFIMMVLFLIVIIRRYMIPPILEDGKKAV